MQRRWAMSEYTPSMDRLKGAWVDQCAGMDPEMRGNEEWIRAQQATFDRAIAAHDAELRERVAQEILEDRPEMGRPINVSMYREGRYSGMTYAADIARGQEQD